MGLQEYQTVIIVDPDLSEEQIEEVFSKMETTIKQHDGILKEIEKWGLRDLAYKINHKQKGYYALLHYYGKSDIVEKLERNIKMNDKIIRFLTIKVSPKASPVSTMEAQAEAG
ncbi:Ribosomal protein S6 [Candidatus Desulfofervidus auxilii]|uniref:Small ribosomal subunit protein bS6 n=1 Tax=Desulfofervidus auxilii TaxID=1621989 RepID=A0A7V1I3N4_DESA2|nr:30S ribosomal protein S6 [Candidatus Desulfofervidus auxilii]CAD7772557.1 MAG: 30S ribosomal protein S6 [Candidatus Methanoperedenaceae archaeon GB37]CAD7777106.1 30S ribosomal protein S6 [Candidatus Methanoperedenaceae archaeon GB50]AMM41185.1 Ribosomal protein S6 [Candidatus Desulfofervidus auxilii]CAD7778139.1 30S ribosomal protein S6 [Candidatus Methanoperedenaceae archaeon GB37]HEB73875.1 30S ribosomal protein S6 [Candidatus Desulfofervidus auxilii]